ncbi:MAG TPA: hypothetical protein VN419_10395 [Humidesulfovibrio sp.]|uniref:hypothetical protein n=1 Tax=Humidesulfovibrio sp. TaxID=2910988 RepID=UPI002BB32493|nr:hypothetical protein [Humidesulfovibrio sp.]HWR04415.1 hypothetical protein [Humidesulfovibrio sp.]
MIDKTATPKASTASESKDCVFCLPFCGLGEDAGIVARIKACGELLLEQSAASQPEFAPATPKL